MSTERLPTPHDEVIAKIDKALKHVYDLCQGKERWTMRVPADESRDSDLIISMALTAARSALSEKREPGPMPRPPLTMNCEEAQAWKVGWYTGAYGHPPVVKL